MNLLLRPAAWFFWQSRSSQGPTIDQRQPDRSTPTEYDDDELLVVLAIQHAAGR